MSMESIQAVLPDVFLDRARDSESHAAFGIDSIADLCGGEVDGRHCDEPDSITNGWSKAALQ